MSIWHIYLLDLAQLRDHWPLVLTILTALTSFVSTLITACTPYPKVETVLQTIVGILSWVEHWDVGGLSVPGMLLHRPTNGNGGGKPSLAAGGALK